MEDKTFTWPPSVAQFNNAVDNKSEPKERPYNQNVSNIDQQMQEIQAF